MTIPFPGRNLTGPKNFVDATEDWENFPSNYEIYRLHTWLKGFIGGENDYEARVALAIYAQREKLARMLKDSMEEE